MHCPTCGHELRQGTRFCTSCGSDALARSVTSSSPLPDPPVPVDGGISERRLVRFRIPIAVAAAVIFVIAGVIVLVRGDESPISTRTLQGVASEPRSISRVDLDSSLFDATTFGNTIAFLGSDGSGEASVVTVIDPQTGDILWEEDGDAIVGVGDKLAIALDEKVQLWDRAGDKFGDDVDVGDEVGDLSVVGDVLLASRDGRNAIVDIRTWSVVSRDAAVLSSNGHWAIESDFRDGRTRVQLLDVRSGERVGDRFLLDSDLFDYGVMDDGGIAVLSDGEVAILDAEGRTRSTIDVSDESTELLSTRTDLISVGDGSSSTVLRVGAESIDELGPDVDGELLLVDINGAIHGLTDSVDGEISVYTLGNDTVSFLFDADADFAVSTDRGIYVAEADEFSYLAVPGKGRAEWTLSTDGFFYWVDDYVLEINGDFSSYQTDIEIFG